MFERGPAAMPAEKLTPETALAVSFVNLKGLSGLGDVRPFDLAKEIAESEVTGAVAKEAQESADRATSLSNLRQVMLAALMYAADHKETLPPMESAAEIEKALTPYVKSKELLVSPVDREPYRANVLLSGKKLADIENPAEMIVFYEATPAADGRRGAAFLDGHVRLLSPGNWERYKRISKIP
jgi:prepilin-type processing-associated H-X9-DG protein